MRLDLRLQHREPGVRCVALRAQPLDLQPRPILRDAPSLAEIVKGRQPAARDDQREGGGIDAEQKEARHRAPEEAGIHRPAGISKHETAMIGAGPAQRNHADREAGDDRHHHQDALDEQRQAKVADEGRKQWPDRHGRKRGEAGAPGKARPVVPGVQPRGMP